MTPTITYQIHNMTGHYRGYIGERASFAEAERLARWHAARRGIRVTIDKVTVTARHRHSDEMASVIRDNLGRLWTDLTTLGATFI